MTAPTISYGRGYSAALTPWNPTVEDMTALTGWIETRSGITDPETTVTCNGDYITMSGVCGDAGDEYFYLSFPDEGGATNINISTTTYPYAITRWYTNRALNGLGARVQLVYDVGSQELLEATGIPQFDNTSDWHVTVTALTAGKTIEHIRLIADDYPNTAESNGTHEVWFDFVMFCQGIFTFPFVSDVVEPEFTNRYADIEIPGRMGDITQYLGATSPSIKIIGNMDANTTTWGTPYAQKIKWIMHGANDDPWQWFTSDDINCKVTPRNFRLTQDKDTRRVRGYELDLKRFSQIGGDTILAEDWYGV